MLNGINIEEVKKYNDSIKYYKDQSARLSVEIEMNEKELKQLCEQLTAELGVEVTPDNIEQVYNEQVQKIRVSASKSSTSKYTSTGTCSDTSTD